MMKMTTLRGRLGAGGVASYLSEYYHEQAEGILPPGKWIGRGAAVLGLRGKEYADGDDLKADIHAVLLGQHPRTGKALTQSTERLGYDNTLSSEKYVSVLLASASPDEQKRIGAAHVRAVEQTLKIGLPLIQVRSGKGGKHHERAEVVARLVHHLDSRAGDPQLHTHVLVANLARDPKTGQWHTIEAKEMAQAIKALGAIFREVEAQEMRALGYQVEAYRPEEQGGRESAEVWHRVPGLAPEILDHFSQRRAEMDAAVAAAQAQGKTLSRDQAAQVSRAAKEEGIHAGQVIANFQAEAKAQGWDFRAEDMKQAHRTTAHDVPPRDRAAVLRSLHAHESSFSVWDFVTAEAKEGRLYESKADAQAVLDSTPDVLAVDGGRYLTREQYDLERRIVVEALARADDTRHQLTPDQVAAGIAAQEAKAAHAAGHAITMTPEQVASVRAVCGPGTVALIEGRAGTGKTFTAGAYLSAYEGAGYKTLLAAPSHKAAQGLSQDTGRDAVSVAQLVHRLDSGKIALDAQTLLVIDEAAMVASRDFARVQQAAEAAGAKIIAVGDHHQLQAVGAGGWFHDLIQQGLPVAELTDIRRQRNEAERTLALGFYDGTITGESLVQGWRDGGMLVEAESAADARRNAAQGYLDDPAGVRDKIMLAHTHADLAVLNSTIQAARQAAGELGEVRTVEAWAGGGKTTQSQTFAVGDVVMFTANGEDAAGAKYTNSERGEVVGFGPDTMTVQIWGDDPAAARTVDVPVGGQSPADVVLGYAITCHKAQGMGAEDVHYLPSDTVDKNAAMVAFTRTKDTCRVYVPEHKVADLAEAMNDWSFKRSALDVVPGARETVAAEVAEQRAALAHDRQQALRQEQERRQAQEAAEAAQRHEQALQAVQAVQHVARAAQAALAPEGRQIVRRALGAPDSEAEAGQRIEQAQRAIQADLGDAFRRACPAPPRPSPEARQAAADLAGVPAAQDALSAAQARLGRAQVALAQAEAGGKPALDAASQWRRAELDRKKESQERAQAFGRAQQRLGARAKGWRADVARDCVATGQWHLGGLDRLFDPNKALTQQVRAMAEETHRRHQADEQAREQLRRAVVERVKAGIAAEPHEAAIHAARDEFQAARSAVERRQQDLTQAQTRARTATPEVAAWSTWAGQAQAWVAGTYQEHSTAVRQEAQVRDLARAPAPSRSQGYELSM